MCVQHVYQVPDPLVVMFMNRHFSAGDVIKSGSLQK